ncbi:MAG: hypothetical protein OQK04_01215, partial [Kangiellaceae bacterium]|nr:hypothetical protein [Kangiellaceae bacterium]
HVKWSNKKVLLNSIAYAIKYHGLVMLRCYQLYASVPARIWRELYILFQIAQENEIDSQNSQVETHGEEYSCRDYFVQSLLLSIANPYQLRQREIGLLWELLPELSTHTDLSSHAYNKLHYVVVMDSASPPIHKSLYNKGLTNNLKLTVSPVVDYLKHKLSSLQRSDQQTARKAMVIKHLIQTWNHGTHRSFARTPSDDSLDIAIGLGATHYILMQEPGGTGDDRSGASDTLEAMEGSLKNATLIDLGTVKKEYTKSDFDYLSSSGPPSDDVWAKLYRPDQAIAEEAEKIKNNTRSRDTIVKESYQLQTVDLMNISPGGYCIQISSDKLPKHAQTGEVLGFLERSSDEREQWSIGVVRWVRRQLKGTVVQMGVQLLAPGAIPINIQLRNSKSDTNEFQRALLLPALTGVGQPATLITNPLSFRTNSKVRIVDHGNEYDARLSKEVTSSSSFKQFEFERIGDKPNEDSQKPKDPSFDSGGIDGVWDLI